MARSYEERIGKAAVSEIPAYLQEAIFETINELRESEKQIHDIAVEYALREDEYRRRKAELLLESDRKTIVEKQAWVDTQTSRERVAAHSAEHLKHALTEISRSQRQRLSALQSLVYAQKSEIELAGRGPNMHQEEHDEL